MKYKNLAKYLVLNEQKKRKCSQCFHLSRNKMLKHIMAKRTNNYSAIENKKRLLGLTHKNIFMSYKMST